MGITNKTLTMTNLKDTFNQAIGLDVNYIGVRIQAQGLDEPEVIINPRENFESKLEYYQKAYNEDLTLKTFNGVKIIGFEYGDSYNEISDWLIDREY